MTTKTASLADYPADQIQTSKIVANNTFEIFGPLGDRTIRLHYTDIMVFRPDGSIFLDSGGWKTVTTKERMNRYLPGGMSLYQQDGFWYLDYHPSGWGAEGGWTVPYTDKIVIPADLSKPKQDAIALNEVATHKRLKRLINKMCREVKQMMDSNTLPTPNAGDCWTCSMFEHAQLRENPRGKLSDSTHIVSHLEEGYIHGSLIANAYLWAGYPEENLGYVYGMRADQILRRYLKSRVGLAV